MESTTKTVLEALAETIGEVPATDEALRDSLTRLGDGQTNPDE